MADVVGVGLGYSDQIVAPRTVRVGSVVNF
jgi:hypothetical protein